MRERDRTIAQIASSSSALYVVLIAASAATFMKRERARQWLDQRFFREEYDARKILLSLASRVRFETDPTDLATMVVNQLDAALHPQTTAILALTGDRGLAGAFNSQVVRRAFALGRELEAEGQTIRWLVSGKKGRSTLRFRGYDVREVSADPPR